MEKLGRLESEINALQNQYQLIEDDYGIQVLNLMLAISYIKSLFQNERVKGYLTNNEPEIFQMFKNIVEIENLNI